MPRRPTGNLSRTFGRHGVDEAERRHRIRQVFQKVAPRYDLMNDLMSLGIHRLWKRRLAHGLAIRPGQTVLDLAGGTGDVARLIAAGSHTTLVCDPSLEMMSVGRSRVEAPIAWLAAEGEALPFADASIDAVTISFGIRNVTRMDVALREILRILTPGGRFLCLEFSRPWAVIRPFYELFSATVIPRLGAWVAREPAAYTYLIESIRRFPHQGEMKALLEEIGFSDVSYRNLSMGIACLHLAVKGHDVVP
jgi:demethylmenaquinone methyltransferase/2-methoxy-6-polyprenyl-1,4-benzoquinol methylase